MSDVAPGCVRVPEPDPVSDEDGCFIPTCDQRAEFLYVEAVGDPSAIEWPVCATHGRELVPWFDQAIADQDGLNPYRDGEGRSL